MQLRKLKIKLRSDGEIQKIPRREAVECLRRLRDGNWTYNSPYYEVLTHVQWRALYTVLAALDGRHGIGGVYETDVPGDSIE